MAVGLFILVLLIGACALLALLPPPRSRALMWAAFYSTSIINEQPFVALSMVAVGALHAGAVGGGEGVSAWTLRVAPVAAALLLLIALRARRAHGALQAALAKGLGARHAAAPYEAPPGSLAFARLLFPYPGMPRDVERIEDVRYGPSNGDAHLLDIYRPKGLESGAPVFVHWHGGAFRSGAKSREALALMHHLAERGWLCVSPNYRLSHEATYPANQIDAKRVIAWVREHGARFGADPSTLVVAGGSAGGHIASLCGLTQNDPRFQPGFEEADTSVSAVVSLYGYYGPYDWQHVDSWSPHDPLAPWAPTPTAPLECDGRGAPPFLVIHGSHDDVVPAWSAREFVAMLRSCSKRPVLYAELPGARHAFDALPSIRSEATIDAVARFCTWVSSTEAVYAPSARTLLDRLNIKSWQRTRHG